MSRGRNPYRRAGSWVAGTGWTAAPAEPSGEPAVEQPPAPGVDELRWGYTLADLDRMARGAALGTVIAHHDYTARYEAARSAIALAIYAADQRPSPSLLRGAALGEIYDLVEEPIRHHGHYRGGRDGWGPCTSPAFAAYWADWMRHAAPDPAEAVVERIAVWQVLALLPAAQRRGLLALAATGDYEAAASATGQSPSSLGAALCRARGRITRAWFAPHAPPRRWVDRRVRSRAEGPVERVSVGKSLRSRLRYRAERSGR